MTPTIAILGSGFGGIGLGIALKKAGIHDFTIYERSADVGGVWRDNTYPGAGCDIPSHLYSFSFEQNFPWSRRYAPQSEILAYLRHCADKYGLLPHIRFKTEIMAAEFDAAAALWSLHSAGGDRFDAQIFVSAVGQFSQPIIPDLPGCGEFAGWQFHSVAWDHDFAFEGKVVGVIGTGASAIQFVPQIAPKVARLIVFQRSAPHVMPKIDQDYSPRDQVRLARFPFLRSLDRLRIYTSYQVRIPRRSSKQAVQASGGAFLDYLAREIDDPDLRRKVTPQDPWGCKRVLISNNWYSTLRRENVEVIDAPIEAIESQGIRTRDGISRPVDAIIYGTGFAAADFLSKLRITGRDGRELRDVWQDGAEAYLGVTVAGFPNFFMMFGPNTNIPGSVVYMLESQARYITRCIQGLVRCGARYMDVRAGVQHRFNVELQRRLRSTVWDTGGCRSWFKAASGKITTQWPGFQFAYRHRTRTLSRRDYDFTP